MAADLPDLDQTGPTRRDGLITARKLRGKQQDDLARMLDVNHSTVAGWESGRRTPMPSMWPAIAEALGLSVPELARILGQAPPIELNGHVVPRDMSHYDSLLLTAGRIDMFERTSIPGLAQTKNYSAASEALTGLSESEIMARVDERQARQQILYRDDPPELTILLAETVFVEVLGGPEVMAEQVDHLAALAALPNVTVRLLRPDGRSLRGTCDVELLTKPREAMPYMAVVFDPDGRPRLYQYEDLDRMVVLFADLAALALPPDQTALRLSQIRSNFTR